MPVGALVDLPEPLADAQAAVVGCTGEMALSAYLETNRAKLDQPASAESSPTQFVIQPGQPARTIAENLANAGLITDARLFEGIVRVNGVASSLHPARTS